MGNKQALYPHVLPLTRTVCQQNPITDDARPGSVPSNSTFLELTDSKENSDFLSKANLRRHDYNSQEVFIAAYF